MKEVLVTGASGFIGSHLVTRLKSLGYFVRGVDLVYNHYIAAKADQFFVCDLRNRSKAREAVADMTHVYDLAADMGGMGYIDGNDMSIFNNNNYINTNVLTETELSPTAEKYLFTSTACVYPVEAQSNSMNRPLSEDMWLPAHPQEGYGWQKLMHELQTTYFASIFDVSIARLHSVYGPQGTYKGGKEKVVAALCRKVAEAKNVTHKPYLEVWGDGQQTRSFLYIDDCINALVALMSLENFSKPINIGSENLYSINYLANAVMKIADYEMEIIHVTGPQGVRGRSSDSRLAKEVLGWEETITLESGLRKTYDWIEQQVLQDAS